MLNFVIIQGNLVADPIIGKTKKGVSVANITLTCRRTMRYTKRNADFVHATFWGAQADFINKTFHKGDNVTVQGRLEEQWQDLYACFRSLSSADNPSAFRYPLPYASG